MAIGVFSFVYHASYTFFFQFFDYVGMFLFVFLLITMNLRRLGWIRRERQLAVYLGGVAASSALIPILYRAGIPLQLTMVVLALSAIGLEARLWLRDRGTPAAARYGHFGVSMGFIGLAVAALLVDLFRVGCVPTNPWIQGHAYWHLFSALGLYWAYRFFVQFRLDDPGGAGAGETAVKAS